MWVSTDAPTTWTRTPTQHTTRRQILRCSDFRFALRCERRVVVLLFASLCPAQWPVAPAIGDCRPHKSQRPIRGLLAAIVALVARLFACAVAISLAPVTSLPEGYIKGAPAGKFSQCFRDLRSVQSFPSSLSTVTTENRAAYCLNILLFTTVLILFQSSQ